MRARTSSGTADITDIITDFYSLPNSHIDPGQVPEKCFQIIAVINDDTVSVSALYAGKFYFAVGRSAHRITRSAPKIDTEMMLCSILTKRVLAVPKFRTYFSGNR